MSNMSNWFIETGPSSDCGGLEITTVRAVDGRTSCRVCHFGATLISWEAAGHERIFLSERAVFDGKKAIRGGIPLVFPQFGQKDKSMAQHGFARNRTWRLSGQSTEADFAEVVFSLVEDEGTLAVFPFKFSLEYRVRVFVNRLDCTLTCVNSDTKEMRINMLLHTYLKVSHISETIVSGFGGKSFEDKLAAGPWEPESRKEIHFAEEVDRVYFDVPSPLTLTSTGMEPISSTSSVTTSNGSAVIPDVVLWNPWINKTATMADMVPDAYHRFVCIEPGFVRDWTPVEAGSSISLTQVLSI